MATLTAHEQLLLELINRGRLDPKAEAERYGLSNLNAGLPAGTISTDAKAVLAPNSLLNDAADAHSQWMLAEDIFDHTGVGDSTPGDRMADAGYVFSGSWTWGENIARHGTTGTVNKTEFVHIEHRGLFLSAGHRVNLMSDEFREIGLGAVQGSFTDDGGAFSTLMITEAFARSGSDIFLTGVAYTDEDGDDFYTPGEGWSGITVSVDHPSSDVDSTTASAGGYAVAVDAGEISVTFSGGGLGQAVTVDVDMGGSNIKLDLVDGSLVQSSTDIELGENARNLKLLGIANIDGAGNALGNSLEGGTGRNELEGGEGNDKLTGCHGRDTLTGGAGSDRFDFNATDESGKGASRRDVIADFERGSDRIDLKGIDANEERSGNGTFKWIGTQRFHDKAGELRYMRSGDDVIVQGDTDGNGVADFEVKVDDISSLGKSDFVL